MDFLELIEHARAEAAIRLSTEQGFPIWLPHGKVMQGWALAKHGAPEAGLARLHEGIALQRAIGGEALLPDFLACLAEAYGESGQPEEGLAVVAEVLDTVNTTGERSCEAELYRLKGELLLNDELRMMNGGLGSREPRSMWPRLSDLSEGV